MVQGGPKCSQRFSSSVVFARLCTISFLPVLQFVIPAVLMFAPMGSQSLFYSFFKELKT